MSLKNIGNLLRTINSGGNIANALKSFNDLNSAANALNQFTRISAEGKIRLLKGAFTGLDDEAYRAALGINAVNTAASNSTKQVGSVFTGLWGIIKAHPIMSVGTLLATSFAIGYSSWKKYKEGLIEDASSATSSWEESKGSLDEYISQYKELKTQLASGELSESEIISAKQQILDIQSQIVSTYGEQASGIDLVNGRLDTQLAKLQSISQEEAKKNINKNRESYEDAETEMKKSRRYKLGSLSSNTLGHNDDYNKASEAVKNLVKEFEDKGLHLEKTRYSTEIIFQGDASQAEETINEFMSQVDEMKTTYGEHNEALDSVLTNSSSALNKNQEILDKYQDNYRSFIEQEAYSKGYGKELLNYAKAVDDYNDALVSGDVGKIQEARQAFQDASKAKDQLLSQEGNSDYSILFDDISNGLDKASVKLSDFKDAMSKSYDENNQFKDSADDIELFSKNLKGLNLDRVDVLNALINDGWQNGEITIQRLASAWGLTSDSATEDIEAFADVLVELGIVSNKIADTSTETAEEVTDAYSTLIENASSWMTQIDNLNAALVNSVSGKGLTFEYDKDTGELVGDVKNLLASYTSLENFHPSLIFEKTANGIHLNRDALRQLQKQEEVNNKTQFIETRKELLAELAEEQAKLNAITDKSSSDYTAQQAAVEKLQNHIQNVELLASAYDGATSAYQKWLDAQSAGEEGDMYDAIRDNAIDRGKELYDKGLVGTEEFRAIANLFSYEDLTTASVEQVVSAYEKASPTIKKFFTDGREGVDSFVRSMKSISDKNNMGWVDVLEDGSYKFNTGDDDTIARELGIDVEAVQAIYKKLKDYGAEGIRIGDTSGIDNYSEKLKTLQEQATSAANKLNEMQGKDLKFNFDSQSIENLSSQIDQANQIVQNLPKNEDDTINVKAEGAQEAIVVLQTLIQKREELASNQNVVMRVDAEDNGSVQLLQKFQNAKDELDTLNQLNVQGIQMDTSDAQKNVDALMESVKNIAKEHPELQFDTSSASALEESLSHLTEDQLLSLGVDTTQLDTAEEKLARIKGLNEINVSVSVSGQSDVDTLRSELSSLPSEATANVSIDVKNSDQLASTVQQLERIPLDTTANLNLTVSNADEADALTQKINELNATRDGDHQITYTMNIVPGSNSATDLVQYETKTVSVDVIGQEKINSLKAEIDSLADKTVNIQANVIGLESIPALQTSIDLANDKAVNVKADVAGTPQTQELINAIARVNSKNVSVNANVSGTSNVNALANAISGVKSKTVTITSVTNNITNNLAKAAGTMISPAHASGTAYNVLNTIPAHADGNVSLPSNEKALVNEMGTESLIRGGQWMLIPGGMHLENLKKGDIILNASQTADLLRSGKAAGHGKAYANGTVDNIRDLVKIPLSMAFSAGGTYSPGKNIGGSGSKAYSSSKKKKTTSNSSPKSNNNNSPDSSSKDFKEIVDWVEIKLTRLAHTLDEFTNLADNYYSGYHKQNEMLNKAMEQTQKVIKANEDAYSYYIQKANSVGLSGDYQQRVRNGEINIQDITDENLKEKIDEYQKWYEKAQDCRDSIIDLNAELKKLGLQKIDNIVDDFESIVGVTDSIISNFDTANKLLEAQGKTADIGNIKGIIEQRNNAALFLRGEMKKLREEENALLANGTIVKWSQEWYELEAKVHDVSAALHENQANVYELRQQIREVQWKSFSDAIETIDGLNDNLESTLSLINDMEMFGQDSDILNLNGKLKLGLLTKQLGNARQAVADYEHAFSALNEELKNGNINQEQYAEQFKELNKGRQDAILNVKEYREAILDLIRDGINKETEAMQKLVDSRKDDLRAQKESADYARTLRDKTTEINKIKAQITALEGDDSASAKAQIRNLQNQLKEAEQDLHDTQDDHAFDVLQDGYDSAMEKFEQIQEDELYLLNSSLEEQNKAIQNMLAVARNSYQEVYDELGNLAEVYGIKLSEDLTSPWETAQNAVKAYEEAVNKLSENIKIDTSAVPKLSTGTNDVAYGESSPSIPDNNVQSKAQQQQQAPAIGKVSDVGATLRYGNVNEDVKKLQTALKQLGYYTDAIDGSFGNNTLAAVKQFQRASGITADGIVGKNTKNQFRIRGYASGGITKDEVALFDEEGLGSEMYITPNGVLRKFEAGTRVFSPDQTQRLWDLSQANFPALLESVVPFKVPTYEVVNRNDYGAKVEINIDNIEGNFDESIIPQFEKIADKSFDNKMRRWERNMKNDYRKLGYK